MDDPGYHSDQHHHPRRWTTLHDLRIAKKYMDIKCYLNHNL